ncbi:hypothetical protein E2C01_000969 [Portunus trituberculatus]|uniref:Uncharacterized protein n=1 Tax=Portunus trituberculatus TaxID=210409 RepID=A0A5B7CLC1_PORTR|nr:hypothetical protein [Portunus trituberculatus]
MTDGKEGAKTHKGKSEGLMPLICVYSSLGLDIAGVPLSRITRFAFFMSAIVLLVLVVVGARAQVATGAAET